MHHYGIGAFTTNNHLGSLQISRTNDAVTIKRKLQLEQMTPMIGQFSRLLETRPIIISEWPRRIIIKNA